MPSLSRAPITGNDFGGYFALVGLNIWGDNATYEADVRFDTAPRAAQPDAPYVEQPCWEYGEVVPGYGPGLTGVWRALQILDEATQEFLTYMHSFVGGCVAAVEEFFGSLVMAVQTLERLFTEREAFIYEKIAEIEVQIEQAMEDFEGSVKEVLSAILQLDLLREDPVRWVGTVGCTILIDVLISAAAGAGAAAVFAKLLEKVQDFLNRRRGLDPKCPKLNSFPTGTEVLMADGTLRAIEKISTGDSVLAYSTDQDIWSAQRVNHQWSHIDTGSIVRVTLADGSSVSSTDDHQFWTANRGWVEADDLQAGDQLVDPDSLAEVSSTSSWPARDDLVWELSIDVEHTFAVSTGTYEVAVHNVDICKFGGNEYEGAPASATYLKDSSDGGPGTWDDRNRGPRGMEWQSEVTGAPISVDDAGKLSIPEYKLGDVDFDGYDPDRDVLLDAKEFNDVPNTSDTGLDYDDIKFTQIIDKEVETLRRQLEAANGRVVEWVFPSSDQAEWWRKYLQTLEFDDVENLDDVFELVVNGEFEPLD